MAHEVELKLTLPAYEIESFLQDTDLGEPQGDPLILDNQYFDTDDLTLNQSHAALRIRKSQHGYKQTLKNKGQAIAGLHQRGEWEYDISEPVLDWSLFPDEIALDPKLKDSIKPIFKTDFTRHVWIRQQGESTIELVLDHGVIKNSENNIALCEIELELKAGRIEDLFEFAIELSHRHALVPCDINKAERGYHLNYPDLSFFQPQPFADDKDFDVRELLQESLTRISRRWDDFTAQENWWSFLVMSRQISGVHGLLTALNGPKALQSVWKQLDKEVLALLSPARTAIALYVDDHSHSRGLSNRILQSVQPSLNQKISDWMQKNTLGIAMLQLGYWLYDRSESLSYHSCVQPELQTWANGLYQEPVTCFEDLHHLQKVAYCYRRLNHPAYESLHQFIKLQMVVLGMTDALEICVITDSDSRAKLSSWTRRLTVEQRHLAQARDAYQMENTFDQ